MTPSPGPERPPRRFRRRILGVLLAAGLTPVIAWGFLSSAALDRFLSISFEPLDRLLEEVAGELERRNPDAALAEELAQSRLMLAQVEVARPTAVRVVRLWFLGALGLTAALLALAAWLLGRALSTPVEQLTEGMLRYARGDLAHQVPERAGSRIDELQFLVRQFNRLGAELSAQRERLKATEKLAAWQDVARALAHELKNPLTAMKMALARLTRPPAAASVGAADGDRSAARQESLELLDEEIAVLVRMTESFSAFAKLPPPSPRPVDLAALLHEVCLLYRDHSPVGIEHSSGGPTGTMMALADPDQLRRALGNLLKNALEASPPGTAPVRVAIEAQGGRARIVVSDSGPGIPAPIQGHAFARSLGSTKAGGSGLGLPITYKIVHEHGGSLRLAPRAGGGTDAVVELPLSSPAGETGGLPATASEAGS